MKFNMIVPFFLLFFLLCHANLSYAVCDLNALKEKGFSEWDAEEILNLKGNLCENAIKFRDKDISTIDIYFFVIKFHEKGIYNIDEELFKQSAELLEINFLGSVAAEIASNPTRCKRFFDLYNSKNIDRNHARYLSEYSEESIELALLLQEKFKVSKSEALDYIKQPTRNKEQDKEFVLLLSKKINFNAAKELAKHPVASVKLALVLQKKFKVSEREALDYIKKPNRNQEQDQKLVALLKKKKNISFNAANELSEHPEASIELALLLQEKFKVSEREALDYIKKPKRNQEQDQKLVALLSKNFSFNDAKELLGFGEKLSQLAVDFVSLEQRAITTRYAYDLVKKFHEDEIEKKIKDLTALIAVCRDLFYDDLSSFEAAEIAPEIAKDDNRRKNFFNLRSKGISFNDARESSKYSEDEIDKVFKFFKFNDICKISNLDLLVKICKKGNIEISDCNTLKVKNAIHLIDKLSEILYKHESEKEKVDVVVRLINETDNEKLCILLDSEIINRIYIPNSLERLTKLEQHQMEKMIHLVNLGINAYAAESLSKKSDKVIEFAKKYHEKLPSEHLYFSEIEIEEISSLIAKGLSLEIACSLAYARYISNNINDIEKKDLISILLGEPKISLFDAQTILQKKKDDAGNSLFDHAKKIVKLNSEQGQHNAKNLTEKRIETVAKAIVESRYTQVRHDKLENISNWSEEYFEQNQTQDFFADQRSLCRFVLKKLINKESSFEELLSYIFIQQFIGKVIGLEEEVIGLEEECGYIFLDSREKYKCSPITLLKRNRFKNFTAPDVKDMETLDESKCSFFKQRLAPEFYPYPLYVPDLKLTYCRTKSNETEDTPRSAIVFAEGKVPKKIEYELVYCKDFAPSETSQEVTGAACVVHLNHDQAEITKKTCSNRYNELLKKLDKSIDDDEKTLYVSEVANIVWLIAHSITSSLHNTFVCEVISDALLDFVELALPKDLDLWPNALSRSQEEFAGWFSQILEPIETPN